MLFQVRRAALKDQDRTFGYPSIVNLAKIAGGDYHLQAALAAVFTMKYGSIIGYGSVYICRSYFHYTDLRQNVFTGPAEANACRARHLPDEIGADENSLVVNNSRPSLLTIFSL